MKKFKRAAALAAAGLMAMASMAGCGKSGTGSSAKGDKYYIGGIGPVTGDAAVYGTAVKNGAQIAVDEINAAGGINGHQIEYKFEDDVNNPETSVNAYNTLKDWGMQVLMGTVTTTPCIAVAAETANDGIFEITPSASSTDVIKNDNVFQVCFTDPNQGTASAQYIGENKLGTKVACIYDSSSAYSQGIYEKFAEEAKNQGFEVVTAQTFTADTKVDFSVQVKACIDAGADLVFLPIYYNEASLILKEFSDEGADCKYFGCDGLDGLLTVEGFDKNLAEGVYLLTPFSADSTDEKTAAFVKAYNEKYNETPNQFAADAYDAIYAVKAAIEKAGVDPSATAEDMGDALKKAITEITFDGVTGKGMTWSASGEVNKAPMAVVIKDGAYVGDK